MVNTRKSGGKTKTPTKLAKSVASADLVQDKHNGEPSNSKQKETKGKFLKRKNEKNSQNKKKIRKIKVPKSMHRKGRQGRS